MFYKSFNIKKDMKSVLKIILSAFCFCVFVLLAGGSDDNNSSKSNDKPKREQRDE